MVPRLPRPLRWKYPRRYSGVNPSSFFTSCFLLRFFFILGRPFQNVFIGDVAHLGTFGNLQILLTEAYEWAPTAILDTRVGIFFKNFDDFIFVFLPFILDDFNRFIGGHIERVYSFWQGEKGTIMPDVWTEATDGNRHLLTFEFTYFL